MLSFEPTHRNLDRPSNISAAHAARTAAAAPVASSIDLSGFAISHKTASIVPATCDHVGRGLHRRCDLVSPNDITAWCFPCLRSHILDLREGNGDSYGGAFDGHAESLEVIADALVDLAPFGPWGYSEADDPEICDRLAAYEPTAADLAELRKLMGDEAGRDHDEAMSPDEESLWTYTMPDTAWAAEYLDPENDLAGMVAERELVRRMVEMADDRW